MKSNKDEDEDLELVRFSHVLHDPRAMPFFLDYLSQIEKVELLFFWLEVEEYKQLAGRRGDMVAQARKIFDKYFDIDAGMDVFSSICENSVDVESERKYIERLVQSGMPTLNMFTAAQQVVELELKYTYFPKFQNGRSFEALLEELRNRRNISLNFVLDDPKYAPYFSKFVEKNMKPQYGNILFLTEANDNYRERAMADDIFKKSIQRASTSGQVTTDNEPKQKQLKHRSSHSVFSFSAWDSQSSQGSTNSQDLANGGSNGAGRRSKQRRDEFSTPRDHLSRPSSFIDMLPISAAPSSAATTLRKKRQQLLSLLNFAYEILDKYLSRSSEFEATVVSNDSKLYVAQTLEKISGELGGGSGKLASVGGFASISTAYSVLDSLKNQLENVFVPAQKDVLTWMQDDAFAKFKESQNFAALMTRIEEETSDAHRDRILMQSVLAGKEISEKHLVLKLSRAHRQARDSTKSDARRDVIPVEERRRVSYMWQNSELDTMGEPENLIERLVRVGAQMVADEREVNRKGPTICECDCHYDGSEQNCACNCPSACLTKRIGGVAFRSKVLYELNGMKQSSPKSPIHRIIHETFVPDEDSEVEVNTGDDEPDPCTANASATNVVSTHETADSLPPEFHTYLFPHGLDVRIIDLEDLGFDTVSTKVRLNFRTRKSSDPDNMNGFIAIPPKPIHGSQVLRTIVVNKIIGEDSGKIDSSEITETELTSSASPVELIEEEAEAISIENLDAEVKRKIDDLKPRDTVHSVIAPCRQKKYPSRPSKVRFWYGACYTTYKLQVIECPLIVSQKQGEEGDMSSVPRSRSPSREAYEEVTVTLLRDPQFGLGLNLTLNLHGYIVLSAFINRSDGAESPAKKSGVLKLNDVLVSINKSSVVTRRFEDVIKQIKNATAPLQFVFARGWKKAANRCPFCMKTLCYPTFAYVPECLVLFSQQQETDLLRVGVLEGKKYFLKNEMVSIEEARKTLSDLEKFVQARRASVSPGRDQKAGLVLRRNPSNPHVPTTHLFRFVRHEHIADIIASLLVGRAVLMLSDSPSLLTIVGESIRSFLHPFIYKKAYCPVMPLPLCRKFAERRGRKIAQLRKLKNTEKKTSPDAAAFLIGVPTLNIGARDTDLGEFAGYDEIREWMLQEHDSIRPLDRFLNVKSLHALLEEGTVVLDIDSDIVEVPRPSQEDVNYMNMLNATADRNVEDHNAIAGRFGNPLLRYDESVPKRLRSISSSTSSFGAGPYGSCTNGTSRSLIPSFPDPLRDQLLQDWESIPVSNRDLGAMYGKVLRVYTSLLSSYREYFLTFRNDDWQVKDVLTFNVRMFLQKCPRLYRPFLEAFLRTKLFSMFLIESVQTQAEFFCIREEGELKPGLVSAPENDTFTNKKSHVDKLDDIREERVETVRKIITFASGDSDSQNQAEQDEWV